MVAFGGGIFVAGSLIAGAWFWFGRSSTDRNGDAAPAAQVAQAGKPPNEKSQPDKADPPKPDPGKKPAAESENAGIGPPPRVGEFPPAPAIARGPAAAAAQPPANLSRCLFVVLAVDPEQKRQFRVGTAWAAAPRHLVTSAAVILGLEELQKSDLRAVVVPAGTTREIRVRGMRAHRAYRHAVEKVLAAQKDLDQLPPANAPETFPDAPPTNDGKAVVQAGIRRRNARDALAYAYRSQANFDAGILELDEPLAEILPCVIGTVQWLPNQPLLMAGLPFRIDDFSPPDLAAASRPEQCAGSGLWATRMVYGETNFIVHFDGAPESRNWSGSPVLNQAGQVQGIYSRTATLPSGTASQPPDHAITPITVIAEFAQELQ
jgi:hypothetical protein